MFEDFEGAELLTRARSHFEEVVDYWEDSRKERIKLEECHHNTKGTGLWDSEALDELTEQGRPALTYNVAAKEVRLAVGLNREAAMKASVKPVGKEDVELRDVINALMDRARDDGMLEAIEASMDLRRTISGEADIQISVLPDPKDPRRITIEFVEIEPNHVFWDPDSQQSSREDAAFVYQDRWMHRDDFVLRYPDHKDLVDTHLNMGGSSPREVRVTDPGGSGHKSPGGSFEGRWRQRDADRKRDNRWYNRKKEEIRIAHLEYSRIETVHFLVDVDDDSSAPIGSEQAASVRAFQKEHKDSDDEMILEHPLMQSEVIEAEIKKTYWLEFFGDDILYEDESPEPYDGWSIVPATCYVDTTTGEAYGLWRDLKDASVELNKRMSVLLEHSIKDVHPGLFMEEDAVISQNQAEESLLTPAGITWLKSGAIAESKFQKRDPSPISPAQAQLFQFVGDLLGKLSEAGLAVTDSPSAQAEAAFTAALRHHKSLLTGTLRALNWKIFQKAVAIRIAQAIVNRMPDRQIQEWLGSDQYQVKDRKIIVLSKEQPEPDPQTGQPGQPKVKAEIDLSSMRKIRYDIEFETRSESALVRLQDLQVALEVHTAGIPLPPTLFYEKLSVSRSEVERMKEHGKATAEGQAAASKEQQETLQGMMKGQAENDRLKRQVEAADVERKAKNDQMQFFLKNLEIALNTDVSLMGLWEKAETEAEKVRIERERSFLQQRVQAQKPALQ